MFSIREFRDRRRARRQRSAPHRRGDLMVGAHVVALSEADYMVRGTVSYVGLVDPSGVFMYHLHEYPAEAFASDRIITVKPPTTYRKGSTV